MDLINHLESSSAEPVLKCVDMHVTGEPARILYAGYPPLRPGTTLLEQRRQAETEFDHIRRRMLLEPRGHRDMYGAILRPDTELVRAGEAHMGVLFCHNNGYSSMCGHATIALGRFLVDTHEEAVFPARARLELDKSACTATVLLHAPGGLVRLVVPVTADGRYSDKSRPVYFVSMPSYPVAMDVRIPIATAGWWSGLDGHGEVAVDFCYGGSYSIIVDSRALGFDNGLRGVALDRVQDRAETLKQAIAAMGKERLREVGVPLAAQCAYGIMVSDYTIGIAKDGSEGAEAGIFFFGDGQIDRSPTGSCVVARMALAHAKGLRPVGKRWTYESVVSNSFSAGSFTAEVTEEVSLEGIPNDAKKAVRVRVEGHASYIGFSTFVVDKNDEIALDGFLIHDLTF
jgi:trans-L-3-hydroxyproline dehydratase